MLGVGGGGGGGCEWGGNMRGKGVEFKVIM